MKKTNHHIKLRALPHKSLSRVGGGSSKNCEVIHSGGDTEYCDNLYVVLGYKTYLRIDTTKKVLG